jgi:transketolase
MTQSSSAFDTRTLRKTVLDMAYAGSTVHIGCAFSIIEVLAVLHSEFLRYPDNQPEHPARDYLVLSKGHGVMAQYACMRERGWLSDQDVAGYFSDGSRLKGLSDSRVPGLEVTSGSLGHGFSVGLGMALGANKQGTDQKTFVIVGDGEINEGPIWEGALFASHHELRDFIVIVDENGFQAMGKTTEVLGLGNIAEKFRAFGFEAVEVDGHSIAELSCSLSGLLNSAHNSPKALIARTVKGKGVSFMENDNRWHYSRLDAESYKKATDEIGKGIA